MDEFAAALEALYSMLLISIIVAPIIAIIILIFVIRAIIKYAAKKNAEAFHYDELAKKIAAEIMRAHRCIEMQQPTGQQQGDAAPEPRRYRPPGL